MPYTTAYTKNYYAILGLRAPGPGGAVSSVKESAYSAVELRRAYRSALLRSHPDKKTEGTGGRVYTVDDVKEAFNVLGDKCERVRYDDFLLRHPDLLHADMQTGVGQNGVLSQDSDFILGLELLDLSDFDFTETEEVEDGGKGIEGEGEGEWTRKCRCGDEKGYRILEGDLENAEERGEGEVLVGCGGCSLWVRVGFAVLDG